MMKAAQWVFLCHLPLGALWELMRRRITILTNLKCYNLSLYQKC